MTEQTPSSDGLDRSIVYENGFGGDRVCGPAGGGGGLLVSFSTKKIKMMPCVAPSGLNAFVADQKIVLEYNPKIAPARGLSAGGKIILLPDLAPADHFAVLVHEVARELLHRGDRRKTATHVIRETEAEAVAFVPESCPWENAVFPSIQPGQCARLNRIAFSGPLIPMMRIGGKSP
jgi:hypothetical protein